jgi:Surface antigen variable number repeat
MTDIFEMRCGANAPLLGYLFSDTCSLQRWADDAWAANLARASVLDAGQQYKLRDLHWKWYDIIFEQQLLDLMPVHPGEIFSRSKIAKVLEEARKLYQSHGYLNFTLIPNSEIDDAGAALRLR